MIFYDYVDYYNDINEAFKELEEYVSSIKVIKELYIDWTINTVTKLYSNSVTGSNLSNHNKSARDLISSINNEIRKLDPFVPAYVVSLKNLHQVYKDFNIDLETLIEKFDLCIKYLHKFSNTNYSNEEIKDNLRTLLVILDELIKSFDDIKSKNQMLNKISSNIMYEEYFDEAQILTLRFYNANNSLENYCFILNKIEDSYNQICAIADISTQQSGIIPVKIESGSLFAKLAGNPFVIDVIKMVMLIAFECIMKSSISVIKDKANSRKTPKSEDLNDIKEAINIIGLMKDYGLSTTQSEEYIEGAMNIVCKNIYEVVLRNSKIKLDHEVLEFPNEVQLALSDNVKYLSSQSDNLDHNLDDNLNDSHEDNGDLE